MFDFKKVYIAYYEHDIYNLLIQGSETEVRKFVLKNYKKDYKKGIIKIGYSLI